MTERILERRLGSENFQKLSQRLEALGAAMGACGPGSGASNASTCFDNAPPRAAAPTDPVAPSGTRFFEGSTRGGYVPATPELKQRTIEKLGSIPGGIVLEGEASDLGEIADVRYDMKYNAFIIDNRVAYFVKVAPRAIAALCNAFANDDKDLLGVSLGDTEIVYGKVPVESDLIWDLKIADHFLGDIVFAENSWTRGYNFAGGYTPQTDPESGSVAVFFTFKDFRFRVQEDEAYVASSNFDVTLIPLAAAKAADGGHLPSEGGAVSRKYEANATHVADNIAHYRGERLINRLFAYGELAAFIRQLERSGFDLEALARNIPGLVP